MKKIFTLAVLMAVTAGVASAQMWVGGYMNISNNDSKQNGRDGTSNIIAFHPQIGYDLNDKLSVAVSLGYNHHSSEIEYNNNSSSFHNNVYSISPFLRYRYTEWGKLIAFIDGGLHYLYDNISNSTNDNQTIGLFFQPGFAYELNDRFAIETTFGNLGYLHSWTDDDTYSNQLNLSLTSSLSLGFIIKL